MILTRSRTPAPKPRNASRVHIARIENAVEAYTARLAKQTAQARLRWLRHVLAKIRPTIEELIAARARSSDEILIARLIREASKDYGVPDFSTALDGMDKQLALQHGFLPNDPRTKTLRQEFQRLLNADMFQHWQSLTSPEQLASRLAALREGNYTTAQITTKLQLEYGATHTSAERLVRTLYNSGANAAQYTALVSQGYKRIQWITARDSRVRKAQSGSIFDHVRMDGVIVTIGEPFITPAGSRMLYPGDRSFNAPAGDIINCRCTVIGVESRR